ncbi:hypothetical protein [Kitasatospora sp. NPDC085879]|uniref:hypothetical protein n=1 Tax=Kitasatospora sp. NPDC085879 TaxID=3154769 RepID=UPI00118592A0|nr:hypothetical protein [Streptomyces sp. TLI_235]
MDLKCAWLPGEPAPNLARHEWADTWNDDCLCGSCHQADAGQKALEAADRERAAVEAAATRTKRTRSWWRRP